MLGSPGSIVMSERRPRVADTLALMAAPKIDPGIRKEVEKLVGESFEPRRRWPATLAKWLAAALLAVVASALIVAILHTHVRDAQKAPGPKKPVPVRIVPQE